MRDKLFLNTCHRFDTIASHRSKRVKSKCKMKKVENCTKDYFITLSLRRERERENYTQGLLTKVSCVRMKNIANHYLFERKRLSSF